MQDASNNDPGPSGVASVPTVFTIIDGARAHGRPHPGGRYRRIVVRMADDEVARLDALRARFPKVSRAALVRASIIMLLALPGLEFPVVDRGRAVNIWNLKPGQKITLWTAPGSSNKPERAERARVRATYKRVEMRPPPELFARLQAVIGWPEAVFGPGHHRPSRAAALWYAIHLGVAAMEREVARASRREAKREAAGRAKRAPANHIASDIQDREADRP